MARKMSDFDTFLNSIRNKKMKLEDVPEEYKAKVLESISDVHKLIEENRPELERYGYRSPVSLPHWTYPNWFTAKWPTYVYPIACGTLVVYSISMGRASRDIEFDYSMPDDDYIREYYGRVSPEKRNRLLAEKHRKQFEAEFDASF